MDWIDREIRNIVVSASFRVMRRMDLCQGVDISLNGRRFINFSSNDYLGLACDRSLSERYAKCVEKWGCGSGASRLVCGNFSIHEELEERLAAVKKTQSSLLFSCGYMANVAVLTVVASSGDLILSDEMNHASIIDGCRLSRAEVKVFRHKNLDDLQWLLERYRKSFRRVVIVVESVFSMGGDIFPLDKLIRLCKDYDCTIIVDDAHATGVIGWSSFDLFGIEPDENVIIVGTLGKAIGTHGAFVASSKKLRELLINRARTFIFTTALPPHVACMTMVNMDCVGERMKVLKDKVEFFAKKSFLKSKSAIFPFVIGEKQKAVDVSEYLYRRGFLIPAIRPPSVPEGESMLRITLSYDHNYSQLQSLVDVLEEVKGIL